MVGVIAVDVGPTTNFHFLYFFIFCAVVSPSPPPSVIANVTAAEEPEEVKITVCQGCMVLLPCDVAGDPMPDISWEKDGYKVGHDDRMTMLPNGSLQIENSQDSDSGTYFCVAKNNAGIARQEVHLTVVKAETMKRKFQR